MLGIFQRATFDRDSWDTRPTAITTQCVTFQVESMISNGLLNFSIKRSYNQLEIELSEMIAQKDLNLNYYKK